MFTMRTIVSLLGLGILVMADGDPVDTVVVELTEAEMNATAFDGIDISFDGSNGRRLMLSHVEQQFLRKERKTGRMLSSDSFQEDWSSGTVQPWTPATVLDNNYRDVPFAPLVVGGALKLSSRSSCRSSPFDGVGTKVSQAVPLLQGAYVVEASLFHQVRLYDFCRGGTGVLSQIQVDGTSVASDWIGTGGTCTTTPSDTVSLSGCFLHPHGGDVEITLQTRGGDCALVSGIWDDISVTATGPLYKPSCVQGPNPDGQILPEENEAGFWTIGAALSSSGDTCGFDPPAFVEIIDASSNLVIGGFPAGTNVKYTKAPGAPTKVKEMKGAVGYKVTGNGDMIIRVTDPTGLVDEILCT